MKANNNTLGTEKIPKVLMRLSLPAIVAMVVNALYNIIDTIFIGQGVGPLAIGGLAIAFPIQMLILAIAQTIGIGAASIISRSLGAGDVERADHTAGNAYMAIIVIGLITVTIGLTFIDQILNIFGASKTLMPYAKAYMKVIFIGNIFSMFAVASNSLIRAEGNAKVAMISMLIGTGLNIVLDPIFIYPLNMGIRGAAIATVISQFCSFAFTAIYIYSGKSQLKVKPHHLIPSFELLKETLTVGAPAFVRQVGGSFLAIILNNSLGFYGGDMAITIFGMVNRLLTFILMPLFGLVQGMQPVAGFNYGANKFDRVKEVISLCVKYSIMYSISGWVLTLLFAPVFIGFFTSDTEIITNAAPILRMVVLGIPVVGIQIISATVYQAFGKARPALFLSLLRQFILLVPLLLIMPRIWGLWGIWIAFPLSDCISTVISWIMLQNEIKELHQKQKLQSAVEIYS